MTSPLITVIVPSHDRPLLLRARSLASVVRQTYRNWEVVVVGDGPETNAIAAAVESFHDPRMRYAEIRRPDYSRLSPEEFWHCAGAAARNHGLMLAKGALIAPLDDDDEFLPDHLGECMAALADGNAEFVYGKVVIRNFETGEDYEDYFPWYAPQTRERFINRNVMFHSSVCYNSRYAGRRYPTDGRLPADYGLWLDLHRGGAKFTSLDTPQAIYYGDSLTGAIRTSIPSLPPYEEFEAHLRDIYKSRMLSNDGIKARALEEGIAELCGVSHAIATPSGDVALILALNALGRRCGADRREVIMPSYAHPSLANAALWNRLEPVFCDVDPQTLCITAEAAERCIGPRTGIIAALHPHGFPTDMKKLETLASRHSIALMADAAAALGAGLHGRSIAAYGDVAVFSLSGTKALTAGEGGAVCCRDTPLAAEVRRTARYGLGPLWDVEQPGINGKMGDIPAALALAGLPRLDAWLTRRRQMEARYREGLAGLPQLRFVKSSHESAVSACKDMVLILSDPESARELAKRLAAYRIVTRPYYRVLHTMPAYRRFRRPPLPGTEALADRTVCVPLYSDIRAEVVDFVTAAVRDSLK